MKFFQNKQNFKILPLNFNFFYIIAKSKILVNSIKLSIKKFSPLLKVHSLGKMATDADQVVQGAKRFFFRVGFTSA